MANRIILEQDTLQLVTIIHIPNDMSSHVLAHTVDLYMFSLFLPERTNEMLLHLLI